MFKEAFGGQLQVSIEKKNIRNVVWTRPKGLFDKIELSSETIWLNIEACWTKSNTFQGLQYVPHVQNVTEAYITFTDSDHNLFELRLQKKKRFLIYDFLTPSK